MGIFDNYYDISPDYIPDNTSERPCDDIYYLDDKLPKKAYNIKGNFVGYKWDYGDTFDLKFTINQTVSVSSNSIVYEEEGECPTGDTIGEPGQQAYNLRDVKSWTCSGITNGEYVWVEDETVSYPCDGTRVVTFNPDMENKQLSVEIYNFRWELLDAFSETGVNDIVVSINKDITEKYKPGVYYCVVRVNGENSRVIQKTMLIVE